MGMLHVGCEGHDYNIVMAFIAFIRLYYIVVQSNSLNHNPFKEFQEAIKISHLISHCYNWQVAYLSVITINGLSGEKS